MNRASKQVRKLYEAALRKSPEQRTAYLDQVCGGNRTIRMRVQRLLRAQEDMGEFLAEPTRAKPAELPPGVEEVGDDPVPAPPPPSRDGDGTGRVIGRFKLLQKIGEGGFGTVYVAAQSKPVKRKVALKIIKRGMDTEQVVARFEAERQALALMDHPNIAKVLDGGATENGRPYFVMELVRGVPITEYCDRARVDTRERLELFRQVCHAVQHAHTKGIIHRDLKPSNVLVTLHDGVPVPKVIDFGIAKAIDRDLTDKTLYTQLHQMVGTPEYMAPEQAEMSGLDIDTRADIYSLGILLYELLTGTKPFDMQRLLKRGYEEILRTIREEDPPRPSTRVSTFGQREIGRLTKSRQTSPKKLGAMLKGDLDWIVMKALDKDRRRRYETASAFSDDIERHLEDQPVLAGPPTAVYRMRKYVRRHRAGVVTAALVAAALVVGLGFATWGWIEASDQTEIAEGALEGEKEARRTEEKQRRRAEKGEADAKRERDAKEKARAALEKSLRRANGTRLSALSQAVLPRDPGLALLLAIEGAKQELSAYANESLLKALERAPRREVVLETEDRLVFPTWSPDETKVATATMTGGVHIWDSRTGKRLHSMDTEYDTGKWVRWRGSQLVVAFHDPKNMADTVLMWTPETGEKRHVVRPGEIRMAPAQPFLSDTIPVVEATTNVVLLLSLDTGKVVRRIEGAGPFNWQNWPRFSPQGARFLTERGLHDGTTGKLIATWQLSGHDPARFSRDGKRVVVREPKGISVRDAADGRVIARMADSQDADRVLFRAGGRQIASARGAVKVWDAATGAVVIDLGFHGSFDSTTTPDGAAFIGSKHEGALEGYSLATGAKLFDLGKHGVTQRVVASDLRFVEVGYSKARIVDPVPAGQRLDVDGWVKPCGFALHPDGRHVVDITCVGNLEPRVWDLRARRARGYLAAHRTYVNGVRLCQPTDGAFSPDGSILVTVGTLSWMHVWDGLTGRRLRKIRLPGPTEAITSVDISPDGRHFAVGGTASQITVFDLATGRVAYRLGDGPKRRTERLSISVGGERKAQFSPDGKRMMIRHKHASPSVWDVATKRKLFELPVPSDAWAMGTAFSPRGRWAFVTGQVPGQVSTGTSYVFDARTGTRVCTLPGVNSRGPLFPTGFDAEGDHVLTCSEFGVRLFRVPSGELVRTLATPGAAPSRACFSPDGRWILGVTIERFEVYVWSADDGRLLHHVTDNSANTFAHNAKFTKDSRSVLMTTKRGIRVLPVDLLATAIESRPRDLLPEERLAYEIPGTAPKAPAAWRQPSDAKSRLARGERIVQADAKLRKLLGHLGYEEKRFHFRLYATWLGTELDLSWPLRRVADQLLDRAHFDEAIKVYKMAVREGVALHGDEHLGVGEIRRALTYVLGQLGRGREIEPHLAGLERSGVYAPEVALMRGYWLAASGRSKEAIEAFEDAVSRDRRNALQAIAEVHVDLGDFAEAERLMKGTYRPNTAKSAGVRYLELKAGLRRFCKLYKAWNKPEKVAAWRAIEKELEKARPEPFRPR